MTRSPARIFVACSASTAASRAKRWHHRCDLHDALGNCLSPLLSRYAENPAPEQRAAIKVTTAVGDPPPRLAMSHFASGFARAPIEELQRRQCQKSCPNKRPLLS
jgi:hypothetical protein